MNLVLFVLLVMRELEKMDMGGLDWSGVVICIGYRQSCTNLPPTTPTPICLSKLVSFSLVCLLHCYSRASSKNIYMYLDPDLFNRRLYKSGIRLIYIHGAT